MIHTFQARAFKPVAEEALSEEQRRHLDAKVEALALAMSTRHPLRAFSPLADVTHEGQVVGALYRAMVEKPDLPAQITPWLLTGSL